MFGKNRRNMAVSRRTALKQLGVAGIGISLPTTTALASETTSEQSNQTTASQSNITLDEDGTQAVDSAGIRRIDLGSSLEIFDSHDIQGNDEIEYYLHFGSCTHMWARYLDGSEDDVPLIYNEWHDIDLSDNDFTGPVAPDDEDWIGAYEVAEKLNDGNHWRAEAVIAGAMAYVTSFVAPAYAVASAMGYSYLSNKTSSSNEHTHFWNWWDAPDGPTYNTSRFSRFSFSIDYGKGGWVYTSDRTRSTGTYGDIMEPEVNLSGYVYASPPSMAMTVSSSDLRSGPVVTEDRIITTREHIPDHTYALLSESAKNELEEHGQLRMLKDCTLGQMMLESL